MDKIIGNCSKHPGHNFVNCPLCEIERQKKLSKNFWDNVQKDVDRVNSESTPEGVTAEAVIKQYETYVSHSGNPIFLKENVIKAIHEYASLVSASKDKEIARLKEGLDAAREDEAIRFAEWYDKIFIRNGTIRDLYLKYKKQNP